MLRLLLIGVGLLPWCTSLFEASQPIFFAAFGAFCHQQPERSLTLASMTMVVCSRCAGVYFGVAIGAMTPLPKRLLPHARLVLLIAGTLMALDVLTQEVGWHSPWHATRLATGAIVGWSLSGLAVTALSVEQQQRSAR